MKKQYDSYALFKIALSIVLIMAVINESSFIFLNIFSVVLAVFVLIDTLVL